jgi:hypothetical protein
MKIYPVFSLGSYITGEQPTHALPPIAELVSEAHMSTPDFVAIGLAGTVLEVEVLRPRVPVGGRTVELGVRSDCVDRIHRGGFLEFMGQSLLCSPLCQWLVIQPRDK